MLFFNVVYFREVRAKVGRPVRRLTAIIQMTEGGWLGQKWWR